jgi:hypothetical protein
MAVTNDQLVEARNAGVEYQKQADALKIQQLLAERSSPYATFNKDNNPSAFGNDTIEDEPGTDPAEMIQLELPLDLVNKLKIMAQENPEIAQGIADGLKISSENEEDYAPGSKKYPQTPGKPWQVKTASALDDLLSPHQNPRSGSLKDSDLTNDQIKELLIRGTQLPQA